MTKLNTWYRLPKMASTKYYFMPKVENKGVWVGTAIHSASNFAGGEITISTNIGKVNLVNESTAIEATEDEIKHINHMIEIFTLRMDGKNH